MGYHQVLICFLIFVISKPIFSDIYMHNPRGSNNRHNENTRERANANLNFDSQNNNRGGYNVGDDGTMYYYAKSILPIQWTNQHSCNDVNADCALILQYTCNDNLRDGQTTTTIPVTEAASTDPQYRLIEDLKSYLNCRVRSRDKNLFTANQNLQGESGIYTRQNPNGNRYGYECPEERDYYPHWQPNDWIDIAILTNRQDLCSYYRENSQNVKSRFACSFDTQSVLVKANDLGIILPNNQEGCQAFEDARLGVKPRWIEFPSRGKPPPECYTPSYTRENHLGDIKGSEMSVYNWTLPDLPAKKCVLRVRYNISTADYDGWNTDAKSNGNKLYVMKEYFSGNESAADKRGYRFTNDPQIQLFDNVDLKFQLAINTAQFSRVFEDRSFIFQIKPRPGDAGDKPIYNLNVRGRRGNIVQVYPAVEYDFVPNRLEMPPNSYVHIQWIGSNTTPAGDGQGNVQNDRNNLLVLKNKVLNSNWSPYDYLNSTGLLSTSFPENLAQADFINLPVNDLRLLAASGQNTNTDTLLNNAKAYFDLGARLVTADSTGVYHYVSTRNNDFSNRDQKARITVQPFPFLYQVVGQNGYIAKLENAVAIFPEGCVQTAVPVKFSKFTRDKLPEILPVNGQNVAAKEKVIGNVYVIEPHGLTFTKNIEVQIPVDEFEGGANNLDVLRFEPKNGVYLKLPNNVDTTARMMKFQSDIGGVYVFVEKQSNPYWIAGVAIPVGIIIIIVIATVIYFKLNPRKYELAKDHISKTKRSMAPRV